MTFRCIYIGKTQTKELANEVCLNGGYVNNLTINYGMTGDAFYDSSAHKWDFRPDSVNVCFLVDKKDLYFN